MPEIPLSSSSISFCPGGALINASVHLLDGQLVSDSCSQKEGYAINNPRTSHRKQPQLGGSHSKSEKQKRLQLSPYTMKYVSRMQSKGLWRCQPTWRRRLAGPAGVFGEAIARAAKVAQITQEAFMLDLCVISCVCRTR